MHLLPITPAQVLAETAVPNLKPNWEKMPEGLQGLMEGLAGGVMAVLIIVAIVCFLAAAAVWGVSKAGGNSRGLSGGAMGMGISLVVLVILGAAMIIARWALNLW